MDSQQMHRIMAVVVSKTVNLSITTYQGISLGATHWYAELQMDSTCVVELKYPLTPHQAAKMNKASGRSYNMYKAGSMYSGFDTYEKAIAAGVSQWKESFPDAKFLVIGRSSVIQPKIVVDTVFDDDLELKQKAARIVEKCEKISWYDNPANDDLMDDHYDEWVKLLEEKCG